MEVIYLNTPPEFSDLLRDFDKYKFLERVKKNSSQDLGSHVGYLSTVCNPNQGMLIALNSFPYIVISPHHMSSSLGILETCTHVNCTPAVNEDLQKAVPNLARIVSDMLLPCRPNMLHFTQLQHLIRLQDQACYCCAQPHLPCRNILSFCLYQHHHSKMSQ